MTNDTIDLRHLFAKQEDEAEQPKNDKGASDTAEADTDSTSDSNTEEKVKKASTKIDTIKEWDKELENRIANKRKDKPEAEVRLQFWKDFFAAFWDPKVADKISQITLIEKDIEKLGFDPLINPLLAFLLQPCVHEMLLADLINSQTYKAIHNAVARRYMADSEFVKQNNYNIIYCKDLYKGKTAKDIEEYLAQQKKILSPSAPAYNSKTLAKNVKIFLKNGYTSVLDNGATLNDLDDIEDLLGSTESADGSFSNNENSGSSKGTSDGGATGKSKVDREDLKDIVRKLTDDAHVIAALQFVAVNTNNKEANKILTTGGKKVNGISAKDLLIASAEVASILRKIKFDAATTKTFVELLKSRLA